MIKRHHETQRIEEDKTDRKYFTITPQLVWALSRSPYDYTLWNVIKMIAGERGECYLATPELADMAMMSAGKVVDCRRYLLGVGLLKGSMVKDPGFPKHVWHLKIPDLWPANLRWRELIGDDLSQRIELKRQQKAGKIPESIEKVETYLPKPPQEESLELPLLTYMRQGKEIEI